MFLDPNCCIKCFGGSKEKPVETQMVDEAESYDPLLAIREKKNWNIAANAMAVVSVVVCVFLHAYFS